MIEVLLGIGRESLEVLAESAPYVLFGFLAAGIIKALVPDEIVARHMGEKSTGAVVKASLLGIPLPLCSCGVLPTAVGLRHQGASRGASAAFMVSTPESGVDSIAITWALLDPVMTVARPVAAFITATFTGVAINALPEEKVEEAEEAESECDCGHNEADEEKKVAGRGSPLFRRLSSGISYAFGDLLGDIGNLLLIGIVIAGGIAYLVPQDLLTNPPGGELVSLLIMLVVGIPLYICATASTPVAAALVLKGLSPGAALVFLLAGPATNAATVVVFARHWGRNATIAYLASIAVCSLFLGWLLNRIYGLIGADISRWVQTGGEAAADPFALACSVLLLILIGRNLLPGSKAQE